MKNILNYLLIFSVIILAAPISSAKVKHNVEGYVKCDGIGVKNVYVTDGYKWTQTDKNGKYELNSEKVNQCVFYVLPSGYEPVCDETYNFMPKFWHTLVKGVNDLEICNFDIKKTGLKDYKLIVAADQHLSARNKDIKQWKNYFLANVNNLVKNSSEKTFTINLGDTVWDEYLFDTYFTYDDYLMLLKDCNYPTPIFHTMGNHDNNPRIPKSDNCDLLASGTFREKIAPRYYSFNLGDVHIICLDDIVYWAGDPDKYYNEITQEQLDWMKEDLSHIADKDTPIMICLHIQTWALNKNTYKAETRLRGDNNKRLADVVGWFSNVKILSGHLHYNYHAHPEEYPNIHENNIAAVCGTWWYSNTMSPRHLCRDGSPAGYELFDVKGRNISWKFKSIDPVDSIGDHQFRAYDVNAIKKFNADNKEAVKKVYEWYPNMTNYSAYDDNMILLNVFSYDTDWKVEVAEDGKTLPVERFTGIDPMHFISCSVEFAKKGKKPGICRPVENCHMFRAKATTATADIEIRVTDSFGNTYTEKMVRPKILYKNMK